MRIAVTHWTLHDDTTLQPACLRLARRGRLLTLAVGLACCLGVLSLPNVAQAQVGDPGVDLPAVEARKPAQFEIAVGVEGRGETDIKGGGEMEELRVPVRLGYTTDLTDTWRLGVRTNYMYDHYHFSGGSGFGAIDPWEDIHLFRVALPLTYRLSNQWQLLFAPILAVSAESGADFDKSITGGGVAGFVYTDSPRFRIGLALGVLSQIEDDARFLILPILHWQLTPALTVATEIDTSRGYGGTITYRLATSWHLKGGLSIQRNRFRLNSSDAVGETSGAPLWGSVVFAPSQHFSMEWYGGFVLAGNVRLEDNDGHKIRDKDLDDPQPMLGLLIKGTF